MFEPKLDKNCCGCSACVDICPRNCISLKTGDIGLVYPYMSDFDSCIDCNLCNKVCPLDKCDLQQDSLELYAAYAKNKSVRWNGSSGGMFYTLASYLIIQGYSVYGAAFDNALQLKCTKATDLETLKKLCKSKYLQSDMCGKYREIKTSLSNGEKIVFCGTPCQVAALKSFLKKEYSNLITLDFICHGVPSQELFDKCLHYDEARNGYKIRSYTFRTKKKNGTTPHYFTILYDKDGKTLSSTDYYFKSSIFALFQRYICLRDSCYSCRFVGRHQSDITFADFHDIDNYVSGINRFDGISKVIVNTTVGSQLFKEVRSNLNVFELDRELLRESNIIGENTAIPKNRAEFLRMYRDNSIEELVKTFANPKSYLKNRIYYSMPRLIRKFLVKLVKI